jgi:dihydrofolate reductase
MINAIAALAKENQVIGNKGKIPWHIPEDFAHFKNKTMGHPIIMGRKTFETFPKPLPGRTHIVITRDTEYKVPEGVFVSNSVEKAIEIAKEKDGGEEIFIIGGGQIYNEALPFTDRLYLTLIDGNFKGDAFFPEYDDFNKIIAETHSSNEKNTFTFLTLEK